MLDAIIYDFDGTIADSFKRQFDWLKFWADINSVDFNFGSPEDFRSVYNKLIREQSVQGMYDALNLPCDMSDLEHPVWKAFNDFNKRTPVEIVPGMDGSIRNIWGLTQLGQDPKFNQRVRLAINTTNSWEGIYNDLVRYDIIHCFDSHVSAETLNLYDGGGNSKFINKPSKVSVALSLGILGSNGDSTIFIGDTLTDLQASVNVSRFGNYKKEDLITIGVSWGFEEKTILEKGVETNSGTEHFRHIVDTPSELTRLIKSYLDQ